MVPIISIADRGNNSLCLHSPLIIFPIGEFEFEGKMQTYKLWHSDDSLQYLVWENIWGIDEDNKIIYPWIFHFFLKNILILIIFFLEKIGAKYLYKNLVIDSF